MLETKAGIYRQGQKTNIDRCVMLFDLSIYGHHPNYIQYLIEYWNQHKLSGRLQIVVSPLFEREHLEVVKIGKENQQSKVDFTYITQQEEATLNSHRSSIDRNLRNIKEWRLFVKYARSLQANCALLMYLDTCLLPLAIGMKSPCPFSGIYFRPTFHYCDFAEYLPSWWDKLQQWRERLILGTVLRNPKLKNIFCLDPFAIKHIHNMENKVKAIHLSDPVKLHNPAKSQVETLKQSLGINDNRQVFLLFGALTGRKGIDQLFDAILLLPSELCEKLCLLLVGEPDRTKEATITAKVAAVSQKQPVQIVSHYQFVPEQAVPAYFQLADVILAVYQRHVGMSGILLLAAAAGKPVLSSNYGLMGEIVKRYKLGLTIDSTLPTEIADGLTQFLQQPSSTFCDRKIMEQFVTQNTPQSFATTIFNHILN